MDFLCQATPIETDIMGAKQWIRHNIMHWEELSYGAQIAGSENVIQAEQGIPGEGQPVTRPAFVSGSVQGVHPTAMALVLLVFVGLRLSVAEQVPEVAGLGEAGAYCSTSSPTPSSGWLCRSSAAWESFVHPNIKRVFS